MRIVVGIAALACACGGGAKPEPAKPAPLTPSKPIAAEPKETDPAESSGDCPTGMVAIPAGTLAIGSLDSVGQNDEHPETRVSVSAFCLDAHEVTVAEYQACEKNKA